MPVHSRGHRKQILLFLVAVVLPSLVLVIFTLRMISQERELAQKRASEERRRLAREIDQHLLVRLEKMKLQEASAIANQNQFPVKCDYVNCEVVLIGKVDDNRLLMPWDTDQRRKDFLQQVSRASFSQKIQRAEKEEFVDKRFSRAAEMYTQIMKTAQDPVQQSYARLLLARALSKSSRDAEALEQYRKVLMFPSDFIDEYGVCLSFYAAMRLIEAKTDYREVAHHIRHILEEKNWLSPSASYLLQELGETLVKTAPDASLKIEVEETQRMIREYIQKMEQVLALQEDFPGLALLARQGSQGQKKEPLWVPYGDGSWLVSLASSLKESSPLVLVVKAKEILTSLQLEAGPFSKSSIGELQLFTGIGSEGESLGSNFRGMRVGFTDNQAGEKADRWSRQRYFYLLALLLVLGLTLFGAYLLLRDIRRDVRMAELRSQFVSSVSHELKTPLTAIRMFAETLRLGRSKNKKTREEYLDTIVNESQRLTRLLNNVLDFSKIEEGRRIYHPEPSSLSEIVHAAVRAMKYPLSQQGFQLHVDMEDGLPDVRVDRDALEQAILNLLNNAMKYSGKSRDIGLRLKKKDGYALIQVVDRGVGIDPKEQKRIFEKFYRIPTPENERTTGAGLGLALVSHIVDTHGGRIEVKSALGKGSTFSIYLPLESEQ